MVKAMTPLFMSRSQRGPARRSPDAARRPQRRSGGARLLVLGAISKLS
jgi:hypothetical protein